MLAFDNRSGDVAMCEYTVTQNPYASLSCIVLTDDEAREWDDAAGAPLKIENSAKHGIGTISIYDDFASIYGSGVKKDADAPNIWRPRMLSLAALLVLPLCFDCGHTQHLGKRVVIERLDLIQNFRTRNKDTRRSWYAPAPPRSVNPTSSFLALP